MLFVFFGIGDTTTYSNLDINTIPNDNNNPTYTIKCHPKHIQYLNTIRLP